MLVGKHLGPKKTTIIREKFSVFKFPQVQLIEHPNCGTEKSLRLYLNKEIKLV